MGVILLKCRKCRSVIVEHPENVILTAHSEGIVNKESECSSVNNTTLWYLQDDSVPNWVHSAIEEVNWTRGKLSCPKCKSRLGSFDFVSGSKCCCGKKILPSIHIVKEKVDISQKQDS